MSDHTVDMDRCATMLAHLNDQLGWGLSLTTQRTYCHALHAYLPTPCSDTHLRQVICNYHLDHTTVAALMQPYYPGHDAAWTAWMGQVLAILRRAGLAWTDDQAIDAEDLAQIARMALVESLPRYHYASRFSTWAYQVIVQRVQRYVRDLHAQKRAGRPQSLDQLPPIDTPLPPLEQPEDVVNARVLAAHIDAVLAAQPDPRLLAIFRLWAHADQRVVTIGQHIQLSPPRVRALLQEIRTVLQHDPVLQAWLASSQVLELPVSGADDSIST